MFHKSWNIQQKHIKTFKAGIECEELRLVVYHNFFLLYQTLVLFLIIQSNL